MRSFPDVGGTAGKEAQRPRKWDTLLGKSCIYYLNLEFYCCKNFL